MQNLKILNVQVVDESNIEVTFTNSLDNVITSNVSIVTDTPGVPSSEVLQVKVLKNKLSILCQPLTPLADYFIIFQSVLPLYPFQSINGVAVLSEDGVSNKYLITAPMGIDNPVKNYLNSFYNGNIYNHEDDNTLIAKFIQALAVNFSKALYDIRQVKNENYLSFTVVDEQKIRGAGPVDRLNEEGAYEILRVGRTPAGTSATNSFEYDVFPSYPISIQQSFKTETLTPNSINDKGFFNINDLILNLNYSPAIKLNKVTFILGTATPIYIYDIETNGYQILDSRYDQDYGFTYFQLEDNQIKLNDSILSDPLFSLDSIIRVEVEYYYKNRGIVIDPATVSVYTIDSAAREVLPPIINIFNLKHAPIVDLSNNIPILGGATFINPNSNTGEIHPAFKYEIPYRLEAIPSTPGQYSIDYSTGTVYVYGQDLNNDGTGPVPPLITYDYRNIFQSELDYVYDSDLLDIVALPTGNLVDEEGTISFDYEEVLIPNVDYVSNLHLEDLTEHIENRLVALNAFKTKNSPITNVFKILNETSGEIYTLNRWNNDKVYFRYNNPPRINEKLSEVATFETIANEMLFVNTSAINTLTVKVFTIPLNNDDIASSTEDSLGSSINTSVSFSNTDVFVSEKWFNRESDSNVNKLNEGDYCIDYTSGIVYCGVSTSQDFNIGSITYKHKNITPIFSNIMTADDIYYQISPLNAKNKTFNIESFGVDSIVPESLDYSDELYLNETSTAPYILYGNNVGTFSSTTFVPGLTYEIKFIRGIYEFNDLNNSTHPFNFIAGSTFSGFNLTLNPITKQTFESVQYDGVDYFVIINENIPYISSTIEYTFSVIRSSDLNELWETSGTIVPGDPLKLILTGLNSPQEGDQVTITYTLAPNDFSRLIIDYNKGDYFIDYTYLADNIIVSYEYGDNVIDFRHSLSVPAKTEYYASYKAGALRDALLKNFGTLVNVAELSVFDVDFNRERYRDALSAALTSFIQGPTINAIKNIGKTISHVEPIITENAFIDWSLGNSLLYPQSISTTGSFESLPAKFGSGPLINSDQTISFPVNSNIRLEEGTFESWIIPQWSGIDNDAELSFNILKDGYLIDHNEVFLGPAEFHPDSGLFSINKNQCGTGLPTFNKDGIYIYYSTDLSSDFNRWFIRVNDGYVSQQSHSYKVVINSNGSFYDSKSTSVPVISNLKMYTGTKSLTFTLSGTELNESITFISDLDHYLFDFGESLNKNRLSLYKDVSGYFNFKVFDKNNKAYSVSADVSSWRPGQQHHVSASWKLNTFNGRDELHLFLDGFEVPNIIKYGQKLRPYLHEKFRTVNPEEIIGLTDKDIVGSTDLHTTAGSPSVTSSLNFSSYDIDIGDIIFIDEIGFSETGYSIASISGQELVLNTTMPATLTDGKFSVNRTEYTITSEIDIVPNIAITTISSFASGTASGTIGSNEITSVTDFENIGVEPGFLIKIDNISLEPTYHVLSVNGTSLFIDEDSPLNFTDSFQIYSNNETEIPGVRAVNPSYSISKDTNYNNILTVSNDVFANDLILLRTLGVNNKKVKKQYYVWSDGYESILKTQLPDPISLDEVSIKKIILSNTFVGPTNSTLSLGVFTSDNFTTSSISTTTGGRTLTVTISGNNTDFTIPVQVTIDGVVGVTPTVEILSFSDYGSLDTVDLFTSINFINVEVTPISTTKNALTFNVKEKYSITHVESTDPIPVIRYGYIMGAGYGLYNDSISSVRDENFLFSDADLNNYLIINYPSPVAGYYKIVAISSDRKSVTIQGTSQSVVLPLPDFIGGTFQVLNVNQYRSGLQNGFFTLESALGQPYLLSSGFYELEYSTYTRIQFDALNEYAYLGSNLNGISQLNGIIDQVKIYSTMLTDTRIGETIPANQRSITKDFNSLKALKADANTLVLIDFDSFPYTNIAKFYINSTDEQKHFQSSEVINENFGNSLVFLDKPIKLLNEGILDVKKEGTIEFWINPLFDSSNDPNLRYYFDAYGAVIEEVTSVNNVSLKLSAPASQILSVKVNSSNVNYFAGGKIEIDTQDAIQEESISTSSTIVTVSKPILQVISVKLLGDLTGTDYFTTGSIGTNLKTIFLGKELPSNNLPVIVTYQTTNNNNITLNSQVIRLNRKLPYQNTKVTVNYIPSGLQGDRLSIFKDKSGYLNFAITASNIDCVVRAPTFWAKDTWHRVKASYKINGGVTHDEMRLFIDGYEYNNPMYGSNIFYGDYPIIYGMAVPGGFTQDGYSTSYNIQFKDPINQLYIGSQYTEESPIFSLLDNFRISNLSRPIYAPYGESIDVNYSANLSTVFPVTEDLYTTYLMNYDKIVVLNDDFAIIKNRKTGSFDFSVNILDSFQILSNNIKSQEALEALIQILKPANSRAFITIT